MTCTAGFADCDGKQDNGCEANLTRDKKNCGACGNRCIFGHCATGICALGGGKGED
jgi:hypothetical protein